MKHKHAEVIKEFVDGIKCEGWLEYSEKWFLITALKDFDTFGTVRIKPEPPKEQEPQYLYVYNHISVGKPLMSPTLMRDTSAWIYLGKVRIEK